MSVRENRMRVEYVKTYSVLYTQCIYIIYIHSNLLSYVCAGENTVRHSQSIYSNGC